MGTEFNSDYCYYTPPNRVNRAERYYEEDPGWQDDIDHSIDGAVNRSLRCDTSDDWSFDPGIQGDVDNYPSQCRPACRQNNDTVRQDIINTVLNHVMAYIDQRQSNRTTNNITYDIDNHYYYHNNPERTYERDVPRHTQPELPRPPQRILG
jgi:hypothetical protein